MTTLDGPKPITLTSYVGFDTLTQQIERKLLKRGFHFNIMLVGETGLGKSTLLNTLFASHLIDSKGRLRANEPPRQTTEVIPVSHVIEENGVKLKLTVVDTPGFGDLLNNETCLDPILKYIKDQYAIFLRKELTAAREKSIPDSRIHCVLYFLAPSGHSLKSLDILVLKQLAEIVNVVPVIAKSDAMTLSERAQFKKRIQEEFEYHEIKIFPSEDTQIDDDPKEKALANMVKQAMPFAVVGSETLIQGVRGRMTKSGFVQVENDAHCDFVQMRHFLTRTHLHDLIESTQVHYETFRTKQLLALKENRDNPRP